MVSDAAGAATVNAIVVTAAALATALATGLGALPLVFARSVGSWLPRANAVAGLLMLAASGLLLYQGLGDSARATGLGAGAGALSVAVVGSWLRHHGNWPFESLQGASARTALVFVAVMTMHSAAEGIGVGVSFGGGEGVGLSTAAAIAVHNIPEGIAISLVLVPRGVSVVRAALWSIFSSVPQPVLALPAFLFVEAFATALPFGLGFAGGAMIWMVFAEIAPHVLRPGREGLALR